MVAAVVAALAPYGLTMGARGTLETGGGASAGLVAAAVDAAVAVAVEAAVAAAVKAAVEAAVMELPRLPRPGPAAAAAVVEAEVEVEALGRGRLVWAGRYVLSLIELFLSLFPPGST